MTKAALIFPGQGAQQVGMGREFYDASPQAKEIFGQANQIINGLTDVIFNGPPEKLTSTRFCQPAIFTASVAALYAFQAHPKYQNINAQFCAGHSLGEYSAIVACGALEFEDALKLVERRSSHMEEAGKKSKGSMAAVIGFEKQKLIEICEQCQVQAANFNSLDQIVITGETAKIEAAIKIIIEQGAKRVVPLGVSGAFHSRLMQPAADHFQEDLKHALFRVPKFSVISNVDAKATTDPETIRQNCAAQITSSVQWVDTIQHIASQGVTTFIEIGPGTVLKGLIRKIDKDLTVLNIQKPGDIEILPF